MSMTESAAGEEPFRQQGWKYMVPNFITSVSRSVAPIFFAMSASIAFATVLPLPPLPTKAPPLPAAVAPYDWSGLYVGGHLGYMWGRTDVDDDGIPFERNARTNGTIGGVMAGYNWQ